MYPSVESTVKEIISTPWAIANGTQVPETDDVALKNGGKLVDATYLYADLADSSKIAQSLNKEAAAKIIKVYVNTATRILRHKGGEIRSFDGDRVMAIFMGADKDDRAVRAAMGINWAVHQVMRPAIKDGWTDGADFAEVSHGVGIDSGEALIIRGGIRNNNDLISVGVAPNVAAKLSDIRDWRASLFITDRVKAELSEPYLKYDTHKDVWSVINWSYKVGGKSVTVYGSSVYWEI